MLAVLSCYHVLVSFLEVGWVLVATHYPRTHQQVDKSAGDRCISGVNGAGLSAEVLILLSGGVGWVPRGCGVGVTL